MSRTLIIIHFLSLVVCLAGISLTLGLDNPPFVVQVVGMLMAVVGGSGVLATYIKEE